ncbi:hypothetical protein [Acidovorax cavernicola]|uniref:hypothetical protein n=1 Tax=Acidovorax cavernicola TaxID=1675792 RepID=UPI00142DD6F4|nr:hypothetical protein [Acidovorax cavernicola]
MLYAVADIACRGEQRCKIALSLGRTPDPDSIEIVKAKCLEWIEQAEARLDAEEPMTRR